MPQGEVEVELRHPAVAGIQDEPNNTIAVCLNSQLLSNLENIHLVLHYGSLFFRYGLSLTKLRDDQGQNSRDSSGQGDRRHHNEEHDGLRDLRQCYSCKVVNFKESTGHVRRCSTNLEIHKHEICLLSGAQTYKSRM